ncbi:hypothetical protein E1B28_006681 [Marasmius oreades]|uniref:Uncharacterized protein n=1 Tax=Marasmius oreades TaxID=181124 RepID=A0A9P8AAE6_9AGAR|nr:uncharacterized protein E1B28_006681 [Marasmius oreades]KAG7095999.1 hypothetical protein E1B28_006681 [Marasmius oreades]
MNMASHRPTQSISSNNLLPPTTPDHKQQRRMTSPNLGQGSGRPPSPLRNGFVPSSSTGIDPHAADDEGDDDDDDDDDDGDDGERRGRYLQRSPSPASSVSQMAASFAQRVGNFVGGIAPRSPSLLPSDAELEAEAERERDRTRREAERILRHEAGERKLLEDRVLALMENTRSPPPPPSRSQTMPNPPSPSSSQKDGGSWWTTAKNKLTPTKELTPAQQVIQDAKTREKEIKKLAKGKEKEKEKEKEWSPNMQQQPKYPDSALLNLNTPQQPRRPAPGSPASPTPSRSMAPNLSPSPMRSGEVGSSSPSREAPPLYAQFNAQGTLDVHVTLLTIAKRFEKLEKWTVGHVRALEERMGDVERWLVDKEKEKEDAATSSQRSAEPTSLTSEAVSEEVRELREEIVELQGRIGEIGREMARMAISPGKLSSTMSRQSAEVTVSPSTGSPSIQHERVTSSTADIVDPDPTFSATPHARTRVPSVTARHSTSPPMTSSKASTGTRLPYPTGDYAPDPSISGFFSPTSSPPSSVGKTHPMSAQNTTGLAATSPSNTNTQQPPLSSSASSSYSLGSYSSTSSISSIIPGYNPTNSLTSPSSSPAPGLGKPSSRGLPVPPTPKTSSPSLRQSSVSPTPRKRYTVALGGPIVPPDDFEEQQSSSRNRPTTPHSSRGRYTASPANDTELEGNGKDHRGDEEETQGSEFQDETIGKSKSARMAIPVASGTRSSNGEGVIPATSIAKSLPSSPSNPRKMRAQSAYGLSAIHAQSPNTVGVLGGGGDLSLPSVAPLRPKSRSKSTERLERGGGNGFVDPLLLRKQAGNMKMAMPKPIGKVPVGQLVAFFDGERK